MGSSRSEELLIEVDAPHPHGGKKISDYVFSPNMQYIVTWSREDQSIVGWTITKDLQLKYDNSINSEELKKIIGLKPNITKFELKAIAYRLKGVSDCKQVILDLARSDPYDFEIIDITTKSRQVLNAPGLKGHMYLSTFLDNGDLAISGRRKCIYIFSKSKSNNNNKQWTCKSIFNELKNCDQLFIFKNGKLLSLSEMPYVIMQWNLETRELEMQYILNWNIIMYTLGMKMNNDNTLLAIASYTLNDETLIYVYSTESGIAVANNSFKETLHNFCFIGSKEEQLHFSGPRHNKKSYNSYILNPYTLKPPKAYVLHDIYSPTYENYEDYPINIISDFIITIENSNLSIQRLSHNKSWQNHLQYKEHHVGSTLFNIKEVNQIILDTLEKFKSNQNLTQKYSDKPKQLPYGNLYTWIIETVPRGNEYKTTLKASIDGKSNGMRDIWASADNDNGYTLESEVLKNGDIIFICSDGIYIFAINFKEKTPSLIYSWKDEKDKFEVETETPQESIKRHLTSFNSLIEENINSLKFKFLPPPIIDMFMINDLINNELTVKLYGKDMFSQLIQYENKFKYSMKSVIQDLLDKCFEYSLTKFRGGDIYNFILFISQVTSTLIILEKYNKNLRVTEKFLSKINLLVPDNYYKAVDNDSSLFHLQHCEIYYPSTLSVISSLNYLLFWISEKCDSLKKNYPRIYNILTIPYSYYSSSTIYSQKTVKLIFPLLNFATYSEDYSFLEIFYLYDNAFTLLSTPDYYKWWNIKALINFKWNTYGRRYYFMIWAIYLIFMCCFLIVATISENVSLNYQVILLKATIFLGFVHLIFEARQCAHNFVNYITSPWNWFDLAAILFPTITSFIWLYYKILPTWIITIAVFLLEIKFLLYFRALKYFGKYFAIMIGVAQQVFSFLIILGIIVLAFAHSLHILLRPTSEYSYNQPSYTDDINNPWNLVSTYKFISSNGTIGDSLFIETPDDNTNLFAW
ncbi:transient receptor potential cation channel subfamily a member 1-like [Gigaspora margarita]|uniref:Transient receptor potential cation channel subfamily a member 1-like n=1 Tax=Gigaspora margarita TaxID=4874 RepID=A0A8H4A4E6_GIGMA|nr:transient receptor potential cation channel subfamily a member 1-like [Gigaspora margarita]